MKWTSKHLNKLVKVLIAGLAISSLTGCAGFVCSGWEPIEPSKKDKLTDGTAKQILKHDNYGERLGCAAFKPQLGLGLGSAPAVSEPTSAPTVVPIPTPRPVAEAVAPVSASPSHKGFFGFSLRNLF